MESKLAVLRFRFRLLIDFVKLGIATAAFHCIPRTCGENAENVSRYLVE